jgi:GTPase SAR1 family protein
LDPAVLELPYEPNIDIRDTIDYKAVMKEYQLGPNGGIMTALNLFTTKFDQVLGLLETKSKDPEECPSHIIIDTPGQIEIFTWSASGAIITESIAALFPTVVVYVVDTERCKSPATFMSNMLYACSIMYKTRLPFVVAFNKTDLEPCEFALEWMQDFTVFQEALSNDESYMASLVHSMSLVLEEFYSELSVVGVSAMTGEGTDEFLEALQAATEEYETEYRVEFERLLKEKQDAKDALKEASLAKLMKDISLEGKADDTKDTKGH